MAVMGLMTVAGLTTGVGCTREKVFTIEPFAANAANKAVVPMPRQKDWWVERQRQVVERVKRGNVDLILIGDSITHGWDKQPELWNKHFAPRNAVNMGFSGDQTQQVLWRLEYGGLDGISPKLAMVMIGTNNSNRNDYTAEQIADGIVAICRTLRQRLPETKILLLAIFPRGEKPSAQREKNARASRLASRIADNKHLFYMDINDKFLEPDGTLSKEIMPDLLHPNERGYRIWIDAVEPEIEKLMGETAR
jgi:beta-glucosidase